MKRVISKILVLAMAATAAVVPVGEAAAGVVCEGGANAGVYYEDEAKAPRDCFPGGVNDRVNELIQRIVNMVIGAIGALAIVMIIYGGMVYVMSGGSADKAKQARQIIIYSLAGLVIAIMAFAIVNFVLSRLLVVTKKS